MPGEDVTLTYNADLHEVSILADLAGSGAAVVVAGWDVAAKEAIAAERRHCRDPGRARPATPPASSCSSRRSQARTETIVHTAPATTAEAQAQADMALRTSARRFVDRHRPRRG